MAPMAVSELRIVLLGKNSSEISRVGNFILGREAFDTEAPPPSAEWHNERARGKVERSYITLINTPHLFDSRLSLDQLRVQVTESMSLCAPGPHVLVLVLQPDDFNEVDRDRLNSIFSLSKDLNKYMLILTTDPVQEIIIKKIITECRNRHFEFSTERSRSALIEVMENMVKENGGPHEWRGFLSAPPAAGQQQQGQATAHKESEGTVTEKIKSQLKFKETFSYFGKGRSSSMQGLIRGSKGSDGSELRIVLLGKNSSEVSRVGNLILSREAFDTEAPPPSVQQHSERARGKLLGKHVTLINTPCLVDFQLSLEELVQRVKESVYLCAPGPHVFLLVLQSENFRKEDLDRIRRVLNTYSPLSMKYSVVLPMGEARHFTESLRLLIKECGDRYLSYKEISSLKQIQLLDKINAVVKQNGGKHLTCDINGELPVELMAEKHSGPSGRDQAKTDIGKGGGLANEKENAKEKDVVTKQPYRESTFKPPLIKPKPTVERKNTLKEEEESSRGTKTQTGNPFSSGPPQIATNTKQKVTELRIILFGKNSSEVSRVGNFILGKDVFTAAAPPPSVEQHSEKAIGMVERRYITLISTPHLFDPHLSVTQLNKRVKESMSLCAPGPHIIVLILQPDDFTETDRHRLNHILRSLSEDVHKYTLTITTHMLQSGSRADPSTETVSQKITREYSKGHFEFNSGCSRSALVKMMEKMVVENGGSHLQWEEYVKAQAEKQPHQPEPTPTKSEPKQLVRKTTQLRDGLETQEKLSERLNLVLCGSDGAVKSSISDLILGQREPSPGSSSVCVRREGAVCGRLVTLVKMPALYNSRLSEEKVMQESLRCVSLCDPGVHAFLLIIPEGRLTDEDKGELEKVERIFGSRIKNYLFLITQHSLNKPLCEAVQTYGEVHLINSRTDAEELIQCVRKRLEETSGSHFTTAMYLGAQIESHLKYKKEIEDLKQENRDLKLGRINQTQVDPSPEMRDLRVVLLGKTGVGKSATGNTILGRKAFREVFSSRSVTSVCQKESAEVRGRQTSVIDTPGLFDTGVPNEETRKEIAKCITMAAPGPHVFLLVLALGRFTKEEEEAVKMIQDLFGEESRRYTMVMFTKGDELQEKKMSIEDFIKDSERSLQNIIHQCGNRYHLINNKKFDDRSQVTDLLKKIDSMLAVNGGSCYTNEMFQQTEKALKEEQERILKEREEEIERQKEELKKKHEAEMEKMKKTMEEERQKQERAKKVREEEFKEREEQIKREFEEKEQLERGHYNKKREEDEERMKELKAEINREREENRKRWEKQREEIQRQREQEDKERRKKEEEWRKKQRVEREKFEKEKHEMIQKQKADQQKVQQEYEQKAAEEEKRRTELEEKIKHAEESKKKELRQLQLTQQREWERRKQEEEKRRKGEESKWKEIMESKEKDWQIQENKKKEQYEQERKTEMERRAREEKQRKQKEEEEKKRIESEANKKTMQIQKTLENQSTTEGKEKEKKYKRDMEEKLRTQRENYEKQEEERERARKGEEERNLAYMRKMHEQEKEKLRRETEQAAREQAEREFCRRLEEEVKWAKAEGRRQGYREGEKEGREKGYSEGERKGCERGYSEGEKEGRKRGYSEGERKGRERGYSDGKNAGVKKVEAERTGPGRFIDNAVNGFSKFILGK